MSLPYTRKAFLLIGAFTFVCGTLKARDGLIFNDVAPISVRFVYSGQHISFLNTSDEIIHDITLSNRLDGKSVSMVVIDTIHPHRASILCCDALNSALERLGLKSDGSGVSGSGLTITCKYYSKPTPVKGWWTFFFGYMLTDEPPKKD
jgi:hypothetical protein